MNQSGGNLLRMLVGAVLISFSAVFVRLADVPPTVSGFYRMFFGGMGLLLVLWLSGRRLRVPKGIALLLLFAAVFFAADLWFWHRSIHYVGPGLATILGNFQVFILASVGILMLGERPGIRFAAGLALAFGGLWLLVGVDWQSLPLDYQLGVWFGLGTAVAYSAYMLTLRLAQSRPAAGGTIVQMTIMSGLCAALMAGLVVIEGHSFEIPDAKSWWSLIAYGLVSQVLGWVLIARALPQLNASVIGMILLLQPTLSFIWDILFFARPTTSLEYLGASLALAGIYLGALTRGNRKLDGE